MRFSVRIWESVVTPTSVRKAGDKTYSCPDMPSMEDPDPVDKPGAMCLPSTRN